jgi:hypothetical protein
MQVQAIWRLGCTYTGVRFAGLKVAPKVRKGPSGTCYNCSRINNLGRRAAGAKISHNVHGHSQGENVKSFAPCKDWSQVMIRSQPNGATKKSI